MKLGDIEIGTKLELEIYNSFNEQIKPNLISQFEWAEDEQTAVIAAPFSEGNVYPVRAGWEMVVYFIRKDSLYKFRAKVLKRGYKENLPYLKIKIISDFEQVQRRQYFRFEYSLPIRYRFLDEHETGEEPYFQTITKDISGGGVSMFLEDKTFEKGAMLQCELELEERKIMFVGEVIRVNRCELTGKFNYEAGILYKKIENKDREAIIGFIFRTQRELRRKGLI